MLINIPTVFQPKVKTHLDTVGDIVDQINELSFPDNLDLPSGCKRSFDVKNYLPKWIVDLDKEGEPSFVKFMQYYYDWLYCPNESYIYSKELFTYIDIQNLTEKILPSLLNSHLPGLYPILENNPVGSYQPNLENVKKVLTNLKLDLYQRKTNPSCINQFFSDLFDEVISVSVELTSPGNISITYNTIPFTPANFTKSMLDEIYEEILHPYGMRYVSVLSPFNVQENNIERIEGTGSSGGNTFGTAVQDYEMPRLGNYMVYNMGDTGSLDPTTGCEPEGNSLPRGITANTADMPTFEHPSWNGDIPSGVSFGNINIYDFVIMEYANSPNSGITSCP